MNLFQATQPRQVLHQDHCGDAAIIDASAPSQPVAPKLCEIELVTTRARFDALEVDWNGLYDRAARPDQVFQNFNWLWHWANHFLDGHIRLRIIAGWSEGRLAMIWPLVETKTFGLRKLTWMGEPVSQYGDALVEPGPLAKDMLKQGWLHARSLGADFALLRKTRAAASAGAVLTDAVPCMTTAAPVLIFGDAASFDDVLSRLPGKARSGRRRLWRRLMERGDITFSSGDVPVEERRQLISHAFDLKRTWLVKRGRYSSAIESDATLSFFMDVASCRERPVSMPIDAVYCGGKPIGIGISLSCKNAALGHIIAHDGDFEKQGVGVVLTEHILKSSFNSGCSRFDMLAPQDAYKMEWTHEAPLVYDWIEPFTLAGALIAKYHLSGVPNAILTQLKKLPPSAGRVIWPVVRRFKKAFKR